MQDSGLRLVNSSHELQMERLRDAVSRSCRLPPLWGESVAALNEACAARQGEAVWYHGKTAVSAFFLWGKAQFFVFV